MVRSRFARLVQHAHALAPQRVVAQLGGFVACERASGVHITLGRGAHAVPAKAAQQLPVGGDLHQVLDIGTHRGGVVVLVVAVGGREGRGSAIVRRAYRGVALVVVGAWLAIRHAEGGLLLAGVDACHQLVLQPAPVGFGGVVGLGIHAFMGVGSRAQAGSGQDGAAIEVGPGSRGTMGLAVAGGRAPLRAVKLACAQLRGQLAVVVKAVNPRGHAVGGFATQVIALRTVEILGVDQRRRRALQVAEVGLGNVVGVEVEQAHAEFVARADAPADGGCNAVLINLRAVVVTLGMHQVQAERGVFAQHLVQVGRGA